MGRSRPPKKLRKVCRLIFGLIEKGEKTTFARKPQWPRGLIALIFEGSQCFVLHVGDVSPLTLENFLEYQTLKDRVMMRVPTRENQRPNYIS